MLQKFYPNEMSESIYQVDFNKLYKNGTRGILFDIDNTLVPHDAPADDKVIELFDKLREIGLLTCLISNNKERRVKPFAALVKSNYIFDGHKPSRSSYLKAMELIGTTKDNTIFIGDQIFTDIYGAKRAGIYSILVASIHPKEELQILLKRKLEKLVLYFYKKQNKKERENRL